MRSKPGADIGPNQAKTSNTIQALLAGLTDDALERIATALIHDYQRRMQKAEAIFQELSRLEVSSSGEDLEGRRHEYCVAMLNVHTQHQLVNQVLNRLGYVPDVGGRRAVLN